MSEDITEIDASIVDVEPDFSSLDDDELEAIKMVTNTAMEGIETVTEHPDFPVVGAEEARNNAESVMYAAMEELHGRRVMGENNER